MWIIWLYRTICIVFTFQFVLIEIQDLHFAYFNIVASFILYAGPYAEQNINFAVYKACYDILFIYARPHALYILLSVQLITW